MVVAPHRVAAEVGAALLSRGANAVEAAISTAAALAVVYPHMNGLGGDSFWLLAGPGQPPLGLNASGPSGERLSRELLAAHGLERIPERGSLAACTVPGTVGGWEALYRYSRRALGGRLAWRELLRPAIALAREGFPISEGQVRDTRRLLGELEALPGAAELFASVFAPGGRVPEPGAWWRHPELAATLETVAERGADGFYKGAVGAQIVAHSLLTADDLARYRPEWVEPLHVAYRGLTAVNLPPNSQGVVSLEILGILERLPAAGMRRSQAAHIHWIVEATKLAFGDRDRYLGDPARMAVRAAELLAPGHLDGLAARVRAEAALPDAPLSRSGRGDTVWFGAVDARGLAVSGIQSLYYEFGSGVVAGRTGVVLQNRGVAFSPSSGPNELGPRRKPFHTLNPAMLLRDGRPYLVYGTMGGEGQPQTQAAVATRIVDLGMHPAEAVAAPRWLYGRTWGGDSPGLKLERRFDPAVVRELEALGHACTLVEAWSDLMGHAGAILVEGERLLGGADPRSDGAAIACD